MHVVSKKLIATWKRSASQPTGNNYFSVRERVPFVRRKLTFKVVRIISDYDSFLSLGVVSSHSRRLCFLSMVITKSFLSFHLNEPR